jgi:hypothetical protein
MATKPQNKICQNCQHFSPLEGGKDVVRGECKKYPPQVVSVLPAGINSEFPQVRNIDGCGQFLKK